MKTITFTCDRCSKKLLTQVDPDTIMGPHVEPANVLIFWHNDNKYIKTKKTADRIGMQRERYHADLCSKCTKAVIDFVKAKIQTGDAEEYD